MSSPAQPFIDWKNKLSDWASKAEAWMGSGNAPVGKPETGWHDEQVRKATESFTKRKLTPEGPQLGAGKKKPAAKKRAAAKKRQ